MRVLKETASGLFFGLVFFLPWACNNEEPKFGPPKMQEQSAKDLPRDKDGWVTEKDLEGWEKETPETSGSIVLTQGEMRGMKLFMQHCNRCHPAGEKGKGPSLNDKKLPDFLIHFQIRNGLGDMPAFKEKDLSKDDVKHIISFVKLIRRNNKS